MYIRYCLLKLVLSLNKLVLYKEKNITDTVYAGELSLCAPFCKYLRTKECYFYTVVIKHEVYFTFYARRTVTLRFLRCFYNIHIYTHLYRWVKAELCVLTVEPAAATMAYSTGDVDILVIVFAVVSCVSPIAANIRCETGNVTHWIPHEEEYWTLYEATRCDIFCISECVCILSNNSLTTVCNDSQVDAGVMLPSNVRTLFLANNSLNEVDQFAFSGFASSLTELYLNNNSISDLSPGVFDGLVNVECLYLYNNAIKYLVPSVFAELISLRVLDIVFNKLHELKPGAFEGLVQLHSLNLGYNYLTAIQQDVFIGVPELQTLNLESNYLAEIQTFTFAGLNQLQELVFDRNRLTSLSPGIFENLTSLTEIDLDDNLIETVSLNVFTRLIDVIELDLDYNKIEELPAGVFWGLVSLEELELDNNLLRRIPRRLFEGLTSISRLSLSHNLLNEIDSNAFEGLVSLTELHLSYNNLTELNSKMFQDMPGLLIFFVDHNYLQHLPEIIFFKLNELVAISLAQNRLEDIPSNVFEDLFALQHLNISRNNLQSLPSETFRYTKYLTTLDLTQNPLRWILKDEFDTLTKQTTVYVDDYATCCFIQSARCSFESAPSPFLSCKRLLPYSGLRIVIWLVGIATILGNLFVLFTRCRQNNIRGYVQFLLITNLSMSDLLMGIYMMILLSVDMYYTGYFPSHSEHWRRSILCRVAGALSLLSSEASVFFITFISIDRFMGVTFPFAKWLGKTSAKIIVSILWIIALFISTASVLIPVIAPKLYDVSEVCVGLPISRSNLYDIKAKSFNLNTSSFEANRDIGRFVEAVFVGSQSSMYFSIGIFTGLNFLCFVVVAICYSSIFITAKQISREAGRLRAANDEIKMAIKMAGIVFSDFCCWMLIVVLSVLVQTKLVTIDPIAYAWIATFVLPINSCVNPFLYTLVSFISDKMQPKSVNSTKTIELSSVSRAVDISKPDEI